jgi:hypothetical protein
MAPVSEAKSVGLDQKNSAKRRAPDLENQESGWRPRYSPTQGFNLLQMSPNWFLRNWTLDARLKWAIRVLKHFFVTGHPINKPCHKRKGFELWMHPQAITLYSTLERAQFYYWNLFSTTSTAWCCCFGVWAPQLTVSTSNSYQPMGAAPVCLLSYPLGIWGLGSMTERRNYMIVV